ncbi:hypothetical protein ACQKFL_23940 [Vreelandella titanicae]|uniref:hypothetical protein n=1 Tax=Vreelandella titanicae TaxID=664683 RepID=UPI003D01FBC8|tara:strand:+ start:2861 stop:3217 length:357 start_codon:yes stop_codon:yes gene_type:complete
MYPSLITQEFTFEISNGMHYQGGIQSLGPDGFCPLLCVKGKGAPAYESVMYARLPAPANGNAKDNLQELVERIRAIISNDGGDITGCYLHDEHNIVTVGDFKELLGGNTPVSILDEYG